jgi:signal transduction histidine kinase
MPGAIETLRSLVYDSPEQLAHVRTVAALAARRPLAPIVRAADAHEEIPLPGPLLAERQATTATLRHELAAMQALQDHLIAERSRLIRVALTWLAVGGAVFGLLFGVLGMMVFVSGVVRRIERLREDAGHLARSEDLGPPHEAADELGDLTHSIHEAARLLRTRDQQVRDQVAEMDGLNTELEAFSYSVSHDLRAPLRHVTGFANLLQRSAAGRLTEQEARHMRTIIDAANRMGRLIDDLLAFSRMGRSALNLQPVSLETVLEDALHEVNGAATDREIAWTVQRPLPVVEADPAMLRLVFVNLLSNAMKYAGSRDVPAVEVGTAAGIGDETVVFVRDNGVGFDMQYAHKLFGVFQRLHSADEFEGTGIGLANVRRIVQRHGGRVWAEGVVDAGATFFFSLPTTGAHP